MKWTDYKTPGDVTEALALLQAAGGGARVIAGGTDLVLKVKRGELRPGLLVDITGIRALKEIRRDKGWISIGAAATHGEVARSAFVRGAARALSEGCSQVGSPQIRNAATLAGNVISAQPAADGAVPLVALEAELKVVSREGERWVPVEQAYRGLGLSAVDPTRELATEVRLPEYGKRRISKFFRLSRRKALTLPMLNGAVSLVFDPSMSRVERARIAIGPVADRPFRARSAETRLESGDLSPDRIAEAAREAAAEANPRTSIFRGSAPYRKEMVGLFLERTLRKMVEEIKTRK